MEAQNRTFALSLSSIENPPPTTPVLEHTNTTPGAMEAPGADIASHTVVEGAKSEPAGSEIVKRGRGRPRKYDGNGNLLSPVPAMTPPGFPTQPLVRSEKRSRGRPRGSGKLQILASMGGSVAETAGGCLTPHLVVVNTGEDVVSKVLSFFQKGPRAACILSATGVVSSVDIRPPSASASGGILRYQGRYVIVSLSGSSSYIGGAHGQNGMLSVSLAKPDGKVFGGVIESSMIAAIPIQVVMATFKQSIGKQIKRNHSSSSPTAPNVSDDPDSVRPNPKVAKLMEGEQSCATPTLALNGPPHNVIPATTNGVSNNAIAEDLNLCSSSVNVVVMDSQTLQPITDQRKSADVDANVPQI